MSGYREGPMPPVSSPARRFGRASSRHSGCPLYTSNKEPRNRQRPTFFRALFKGCQRFDLFRDYVLNKVPNSQLRPQPHSQTPTLHLLRNRTTTERRANSRMNFLLANTEFSVQGRNEILPRKVVENHRDRQTDRSKRENVIGDGKFQHVRHEIAERR